MARPHMKGLLDQGVEEMIHGEVVMYQSDLVRIFINEVAEKDVHLSALKTHIIRIFFYGKLGVAGPYPVSACFGLACGNRTEDWAW